MIKLLAISMCLGLSLSVSAQKLVPKFTYNVELGLPVSASNLPFRDIMQGLASVNTFGQYTFPFHLNLGVGIKYSYFAVNQFSVSEAVLEGFTLEVLSLRLDMISFTMIDSQWILESK